MAAVALPLTRKGHGVGTPVPALPPTDLDVLRGCFLIVASRAAGVAAPAAGVKSLVLSAARGGGGADAHSVTPAAAAAGGGRKKEGGQKSSISILATLDFAAVDEEPAVGEESVRSIVASLVGLVPAPTNGAGRRDSGCKKSFISWHAPGDGNGGCKGTFGDLSSFLLLFETRAGFVDSETREKREPD
jgi:hypothetical protein